MPLSPRSTRSWPGACSRRPSASIPRRTASTAPGRGDEVPEELRKAGEKHLGRNPLSPEVVREHFLKDKARVTCAERGKTGGAVFGQWKDGRRFCRFMRRGRETCSAEWILMCSTHTCSSYGDSRRRSRKTGEGGNNL